ncbi:hypothetical protein KAH55_06860 [bacterium]|nr:hypothetical protein [bacterium]
MAKTWTVEEEQFLIENYTKMSNLYLADHFGVTAKSISHKMRRIRDRNVREQQKLSSELDHIRHLEKEQTNQEQLQMDNLVPVNLPEFEHLEKEIQENGCCEKLISTSFFVKTEDGWTPLMIHKKRLVTS